jgi:cytochrome c553
MFHQLTFITLITFLSVVANAQDPAVSDMVDKALAAQPNAAHGRLLYAKRCATCHGPNGWGDGLEDIPSLAGQRELYLMTQLAEFVTRARSGSAMHEATSSAEVKQPRSIRNLAAFLSRLPANPDPEHAEDKVSLVGESLFQHHCAPCHGQTARGSSQDPIPALASQHYDYTLIQLKSFARGHRGQVNTPVMEVIAGLSDDEQKSIADYLSRMKATAPNGSH